MWAELKAKQACLAKEEFLVIRQVRRLSADQREIIQNTESRGGFSAWRRRAGELAREARYERQYA
jgi:hypothetical protein